MIEDEEHAALTKAQHDVLAGFSALDGIKLHGNTKNAIEAMAYEGLPLTLAADRFDIRRDNFARVLRRPEVRRAYKQLLATIRDNAAQAAYMRINDMSMNAKSERVRLMANEWIAGVDGISKVQKVEGALRHQVIFGGFEYPDLRAKTVTPREEDG